MKLAPNSKVKRTSAVATRKIADEILLVPIRTDPRQKLGIYTLNRTAALLWEWLEEQPTIEQLAKKLIDRFETTYPQALADTETFCLEMLQLGALEICDQKAED